MKYPEHSMINRFLVESLGPAAWPRTRLDPTQWEVLWRAARDHCISPYLHECWIDSGFIANVPRAVADRFSRATSDNRERNRRLTLALDELCTALEGANIPVLVSKGLPVAHAYYGGLGLRVLYDLDLLVKPQDEERARKVAETLGYIPFFKDHRKQQLLWRPRAYAWDDEHVFDPNRPCMVELHTSPWQRRWHGFHLECEIQLWEGARTLACDGVMLRVPREEKLLVHLAVHYACNVLEANARLMHLLDLSLLLRRRSGALDWQLILYEAERSRARPFCFIALDLASRLAGDCLYPDRARDALRSATPRAMVDWVAMRGLEDVASMSIHHRRKSLIYFLHWNMARGLSEKAAMLSEAVRGPMRDEGGVGPWRSLASRMAQRFGELARASCALRGARS